MCTRKISNETTKINKPEKTTGDGFESKKNKIIYQNILKQADNGINVLNKVTVNRTINTSGEH